MVLLLRTLLVPEALRIRAQGAVPPLPSGINSQEGLVATGSGPGWRHWRDSIILASV